MIQEWGLECKTERAAQEDMNRWVPSIEAENPGLIWRHRPAVSEILNGRWCWYAAASLPTVKP